MEKSERRYIMKRLPIFVLVFVLCLFMVNIVSAAPKKIKAKPFIFDPDDSGIVVAAWVTQLGLPDAGKSDHALYLQKDGDTSVEAAAGAIIRGVEGITLYELGFDVRNDGDCGAGAPRFHVITTTGDLYFFGCAGGTHTQTPIDDEWTQVRFTNADASPQLSDTPSWPGFGIVTVGSIMIIFDEVTDPGQGFTYLDNIDINGVLIGKPGNAKYKLMP
jgi:hypothetical protein